MASPSLSASQKGVLNQILSEAASSKSTGGLFFGVTTADQVIYMHQEGTKFVDDPTGGAVDEDTVYWLCSQTKLITTIAALQIIEQGKIALDTPVETVLPELADPVVVTGYDEAGRPATLLNHSSGLDYSLDGSGCQIPWRSHIRTATRTKMWSWPGVPLKFEPGTDYTYGYSTDCAGFIVERLSGKSLEQYFQDHVFAPLGITSASFYLTPSLKDRLMPLASRNASGIVVKWDGPPVFDQNPAHAGTATSPILSRASVDSMFSPSLPPAGAVTLQGKVDPEIGIPIGGADWGRGLLVNTVDVPGKRRSGSGTWGGWASTSYFVDPATGVAAVFGMQVAPKGDDTHKRLLSVLEKTVYAALA
ncbi:beta-lactamase/transpeptidase-like protein [Mycena leptocephala]|nr:beta-lactamase/transpeptidase-like protein [Mycena leptocephala]